MLFIELGIFTFFEILESVGQTAGWQQPRIRGANHKSAQANHLEFLKHCTLAFNVKAADFVSLAVSFSRGRDAAMPIEGIDRRPFQETWATGRYDNGGEQRAASSTAVRSIFVEL
jgi:hypothetical protein